MKPARVRGLWLCTVAAAIVACTSEPPAAAPDAAAARPASSAATPPAEPAEPAEPKITVVRARELGEGTATLSWEPPKPTGDMPTANSEIVGYAIYVGPSADALALEAIITGAAVNRYVVDKLPRGKNYFAVSSFARSGEESDKSPIGTKVID